MCDVAVASQSATARESAVATDRSRVGDSAVAANKTAVSKGDSAFAGVAVGQGCTGERTRLHKDASGSWRWIGHYHCLLSSYEDCLRTISLKPAIEEDRRKCTV